jgi:transcriptional regulator with XRE-family HTH domain
MEKVSHIDKKQVVTHFLLTWWVEYITICVMDFKMVNDFSELVLWLKKSRREGTAEYSYNQLASRVGFKSPRSLAMVQRQQRPPSLAMVKNVCDYLSVTPKEREFIFLLAEKSRLQRRQQSTTTVDRKIETYRAIHSLRIEDYESIPGVTITIDDRVHREIRKRLEEVLRELLFEFGTPKKGRRGSGGTESAILPDEPQRRADDRNPDCSKSSIVFDRL